MKKIRIMGYILCVILQMIFFAILPAHRLDYLKWVLGILCVIGWANQFYLEKNIYIPIRESVKKLNGNQEIIIEQLFSGITNKDYYLKQMEELVERYVEIKVRNNNLEIFSKQTELTALQSQINPHFLYNTLDTIRGQAMIDENLEVANMIECLSSFFRYSISRKGGEVPLRDELNNIRNYMKILQYRFQNRFKMEIVIDEEDMRACDFYVPKLILQPIVENAIIHGLEEKACDGNIAIEIAVADELIITISDNGKGLTLDELDHLNEQINPTQFVLEEGNKKENASTGIALPNISKRIKLLYGEKYGLSVYSSIGCGTDVEIVLPIKQQAEGREESGEDRFKNK